VQGPDGAGELRRRGVARRADLVAMGVPRSEIDAVAAPGAGGHLLDPALALALGERLVAAVAAHDAADPLDPGLPLEAARRALDLPDARLVEVVLKHGGSGPTAGLTLRDGRIAAVAGAGLPPAVRAALDEVRAELQRRPFDAPEAGRLAALGLGSRQLASLVRNGELLRVADGVVLLPGADDRAVEVLATLGPEFTLSAARQALGTSRRVAVPLLELLARTGRTERTADGGHRLVPPRSG
jgi:selenocysteine-specific elongation factor